MAARKNPLNNARSYGLQGAKQLLNRLKKCADGELELSTQQIKAAQIYIGKYVPDLKAIEHSTDPNKPFRQRVELAIVDAAD